MRLAVRARGTIGEQLKRAREQRGIDLERAAAETRIDREHLEALERDAPPAAFPGLVFERAFLREYARYLGLNPKPLLEIFRHEYPDAERPLLGGPSPLDRRRGRLIGLVLLVLVLAAAGTVTLLLARSDDEPNPPAAGSPRPPATQPPETTPPPTDEGPAAIDPGGVVLRVKVTGAPSWVEVVKGGQQLIADTQLPGFAQSFRAPHRLEIVLGNPEAVRLRAGGELVLGLPTDGQVYAATFVYREGEIRELPAV